MICIAILRPALRVNRRAANAVRLWFPQVSGQSIYSLSHLTTTSESIMTNPPRAGAWSMATYLCKKTFSLLRLHAFAQADVPVADMVAELRVDFVQISTCTPPMALNVLSPAFAAISHASL